VGKVRLRYYVVINGNGHWKPGPHARAAGFTNIPCGPDGPKAWDTATQWIDRWDRTRRGLAPAPNESANLKAGDAEELAIYPTGSIGDAFRRYRRTDSWMGKKKPATRNDWFAGWKHIKPILGDVDPTTVDFEIFDAFRADIEKRHGAHAAWRATKIWRALWKVMAAMGMCLKDGDPSLGLSNSAPKGRSATWSEGEVLHLIKWAIRNRYLGAAACMAVVWDSGLQPGDARTLTPGHAYEDAQGLFFDLSRGKTARGVLATLSRRTTALLDAYIQDLPVELLDKSPIFRNRSGAPYTKDKLAADFRTIRKAVFGEDEDRKLMDFRRSGAVEAQVGDASPDHVGKKLGNSLATSSVLQETYQPVRAATVRLVDDARMIGRGRLRGNDSATKVAIRWRQKSP